MYLCAFISLECRKCTYVWLRVNAFALHVAHGAFYIYHELNVEIISAKLFLNVNVPVWPPSCATAPNIYISEPISNVPEAPGALLKNWNCADRDIWIWWLNFFHSYKCAGEDWFFAYPRRLSRALSNNSCRLYLVAKCRESVGHL